MIEQVKYLANSGSSTNHILKYLNPETMWLNLPFIMTLGKTLKLGIPYLKTENWLADSKTEAIWLLDVWDADGIVYIKIQSLATLEIDTLSWNLEYSGGYWLWSLASLNYIISMTDRKNSNNVDDKELLEFDF
jgi:hypothetical protein